MDVPQDLLDEELGAPVGIGGGEREGLADRHAGRIPVDGCRGAEDDVLHPRRRHGLAEGQGAADVVVVVSERHLDRLAHGLQARKMDHGVEGVVAEDSVQGRTVAQVRFHEGQVPPGDVSHPTQGLLLAVA